MPSQTIAASKGANPGQLASSAASGSLTEGWGDDEAARGKLLSNLAFGVLLARYRTALERDCP